jgi:pimeloyl-ACP methyl ester carboxylesterase
MAAGAHSRRNTAVREEVRKSAPRRLQMAGLLTVLTVVGLVGLPFLEPPVASAQGSSPAVNNAPSRPATPSVILAPLAGPPGTRVTATGSGWVSGERAVADWRRDDLYDPVPLARFIVSANGSFTFSFVVPDVGWCCEGLVVIESLETGTAVTIPFAVLMTRPGDVHETAESAYLLKDELDESGTPALRRYRLPKLPEGSEARYQLGELPWPYYGIHGYNPNVLKIPEFPLPVGGTVQFWDGTTKRRLATGGVKFVFIAGVNTRTGDNTFSPIISALQALGFNESDTLPATYRVDITTPLIGLPYTRNDSIQDPHKSLDQIDRLLYLWKHQFPLDKFWLFGHSQGGWLAYELAKRHPDSVIGVITLDGALKGASVTSLPPSIEGLAAGLIRGEAGQFFIARGADPRMSDIVEADFEALQKRGVLVFTFASTDDDIVKPRYALVEHSHTTFWRRGPNGPERMTVDKSFSMGAWLDWDVAKDMGTDPECREVACLRPDFSEAPVAAPSAQVRQFVGRHGAVLQHPQILDYVTIIVGSTSPTLVDQLRSSRG